MMDKSGDKVWISAPPGNSSAKPFLPPISPPYATVRPRFTQIGYGISHQKVPKITIVYHILPYKNGMAGWLTVGMVIFGTGGGASTEMWFGNAPIYVKKISTPFRPPFN